MVGGEARGVGALAWRQRVWVISTDVLEHTHVVGGNHAREIPWGAHPPPRWVSEWWHFASPLESYHLPNNVWHGNALPHGILVTHRRGTWAGLPLIGGPLPPMQVVQWVG